MVDYREIYREAFRDPKYCSEPNAPRYHFAKDCFRRWGVKTIMDIGAGRHHLRDILGDDFIYHSTNVDTHLGDFDLTKPHSDVFGKWQAVACLDVLEHLEQNKVGIAIDNLRYASKRAVICVSNHSSVPHGVELHLTQQDGDWWEKQIGRRFDIVDKDLSHPRSYFYQCEHK